MAKQPYIAVVGSANVDLTTFINEFPRPGETIFGKKFDLGFGGKGANQAVAARLCGAAVCMVAKVGSDLFGPATIENFNSFGIDASHVRIIEGVSSGVAPIFVDASGQNRIIVVSGANDALLPQDLDLAAPILRKADYIVLQFEIPLNTVYHAIHFAKSNGIRCILNPAPGRVVDMSELAAVDYFVPNESEALLRQGIRRVIITLGERGALLSGPDEMEFVPGFRVKTIDSTGAGDAFIGSFAVFAAEGLPEVEALTRANLYAALSTTRVGTQKSFLNRSEFEEEWKALGGCS
jgi:ribokinase